MALPQGYMDTRSWFLSTVDRATFISVPEALLRSKRSKRDDGAVAGDQPHVTQPHVGQQIHPGWAGHQLTMAHVFPAQSCWAELGSLSRTQFVEC